MSVQPLPSTDCNIVAGLRILYVLFGYLKGKKGGRTGSRDTNTHTRTLTATSPEAYESKKCDGLQHRCRIEVPVGPVRLLEGKVSQKVPRLASRAPATADMLLAFHVHICSCGLMDKAPPS